MPPIPRRLLLASATALLPVAALAAPVQTRSADGVTVFGEAMEPAGRAPRARILLFHMAGSNLGEYATIAPELVRRGFATLAIDQRSGGPGWGRSNRTAKAFRSDPGYRAALPDLAAALASAKVRNPDVPVLLWGSSYSAALVFLLAAEADVTGVLAFSPGEYLRGVSVRGAAARVARPVFVTSASDAAEEAAAAAILAAVPGRPKSQFRPRAGLHGSSTLLPDRNPRGAMAAWAEVDRFLELVAPA